MLFESENVNYKITEAEARKKIDEMNLINGFLFDSIMDDKEDARILISRILGVVFNRKISAIEVEAQKEFKPVDTPFHGIRLDAFAEEKTGRLITSVYDVEMEDRAADKPSLPRRLRYYTSLSDNKLLSSGRDYTDLPDYTSITILSYDPFSAGDMYYEAGTVLTSHNNLEYDDGICHIYLYCNGKINESMNNEHGKRIHELLKYLVSGDKPETDNADIKDIDDLVLKTKQKKEITRRYMKQWDRENQIRREVREETKLELAKTVIRFNRNHDISDEETKDYLQNELLIASEYIDGLLNEEKS